MSEYQDWKPITLSKRGASKPKKAHDVARAQRSGAVETQRKVNHTAPSNARKLDEETEDFRHQRVTVEFKVALMKARQAKKLSQKQLAAKLAVKASVINDYESGRAIPNGQLISKLNRVLGTKLPKIPKKKKKKSTDA